MNFGRLELLRFVIVVSNMVFVGLYLVLCFNNRLATDDFHFLSNLQGNNILQATIQEYGTWSARWASVFLNHSVLSAVKLNAYNLAFFGVCNLLVFITIIYLCIKEYFIQGNIGSSKSAVHPLSISVLLVSVIFISTLKIGESWFWLCSSTTYLWSTMFFIYCISWLFSQSRKKIKTWFAIIFFIYIGGSSGPLALLTLFIMSFLLIGFKTGVLTRCRKEIVSKCVIGILSCALSFIVLYISEKNRIRELAFEQINLIESVILNFKMIGIIFFKRIGVKMPYYLALTLLAMLLTPYNTKGSKKASQLRKQLLIGLIIYLSVIFFYQLSITYKTQDVAAYRALFFINVITVGFCLFVGINLGKLTQLNTLKKSWLPVLLILFLTFNFGLQFINQYQLTSEYSKAYDQRIEMAERGKLKIGTLEFQPLPASGMLYSAELSPDTNHFSNQHFKKAFLLTSNVKVRP